MTTITLRERIDELIAQHGTLRATARVLMTDCGYLHRLRSGEKTEPGDPLLRRMGLREVTRYECVSSTPAQVDGAPDALRGVEQTEPFWCHEQSHDRPRCEAQCAECAEDGVPVSDPDRFIGGAAGEATYARAAVDAALRNANPARSQEDGYCAASGVQPLKGKSHE